jgi:hypothetical protein
MGAHGAGNALASLANGDNAAGHGRPVPPACTASAGHHAPARGAGLEHPGQRAARAVASRRRRYTALLSAAQIASLRDALAERTQRLSSTDNALDARSVVVRSRSTSSPKTSS